MMGLGLGFGFVGLFFMLLFWIGLIAGGVWIVKVIFSNNHGSQNPRSNQGSDPRAIVDKRYARGEISREQYETMKEDLNSLS